MNRRRVLGLVQEALCVAWSLAAALVALPGGVTMGSGAIAGLLLGAIAIAGLVIAQRRAGGDRRRRTGERLPASSHGHRAILR